MIKLLQGNKGSRTKMNMIVVKDFSNGKELGTFLGTQPTRLIFDWLESHSDDLE